MRSSTGWPRTATAWWEASVTTAPGAGVKGRRKYESAVRRERAMRTRGAILDAARRLFLVDGYAPTTVASIARAAGVSEETIFKAFGGKAGLVRAIWEMGLKGAGPTPAERRSDALRTEANDPREIIEGWGRLVTEVAPLASPILLLVRAAAATDPEIAELLEAIDRGRLERMETNARGLFERGFLAEGIGLEDARDVLWTYSSPELYELLVIRRGWPIERFGDSWQRA